MIDKDTLIKAELLSVHGRALNTVVELMQRMSTCKDINQGIQMEQEMEIWSNHLFKLEELLLNLGFLNRSQCCHLDLNKEDPICDKAAFRAALRKISGK